MKISEEGNEFLFCFQKKYSQKIDMRMNDTKNSKLLDDTNILVDTIPTQNDASKFREWAVAITLFHHIKQSTFSPMHKLAILTTL